MYKKDAIYAVYRGDQFIDVGTLEELGKRLGVTPYTVYFYSTPRHKKRMVDKDKCLESFIVNEEEE